MEQPVSHRPSSNHALIQRPHRHKLPRKSLQKAFQPKNILTRSSIRMHADRPHPILLLNRPPKLLWNPRHPEMPKRLLRKPIRNHPNPLVPQHLQRHRIETMPRRYPDHRIKPMPAQDLQPRPNPTPLLLTRHTSKLRSTMQRHQAPRLRITHMPITMQPDRRPTRFQSPHLLPETLIRRVDHQLRIAIVRRHPQNRLDLKPLDQRRKPTPPFPIHRRAKIVKPQQILSLHAATGPSALGEPASLSPGGGSSR